jgi:hypothetical protein
MKKRRRMVAFASLVCTTPPAKSLTTGFPGSDRKDVVLRGSASHRTAWLFTRGDSSVSMTVNEDPSGIVLVVLGPGAASATYRFTDMAALTAFAEGQEQKLIDEGFHLQAVAERRTGRTAPPSGVPDRRRR